MFPPKQLLSRPSIEGSGGWVRAAGLAVVCVVGPATARARNRQVEHRRVGDGRSDPGRSLGTELAWNIE